MDFKLKRLLFLCPSFKVGKRESKRGDHWLLPPLAMEGGERIRRPPGHKDPMIKGASHQHALTAGDQEHGQVGSGLDKLS